MAYYSGTASSLADLRTALLTHAVADGWASTGDTTFTASISYNTMTVSAVAAGSIQVGEVVTGPGVAPGTIVTALDTGTGGIGTYTVNLTQFVGSGSMTQPGRVLSKAGVFFRIGLTDKNVTCLGGESNVMANPAPNEVSIGRIFRNNYGLIREMQFPCNYEIMGFAQELYLVVNYNVDHYQWMAFGKSTVQGLPGQGGWCGATIGRLGFSTSSSDAIVVNENGGGAEAYGNENTAAALFWATNYQAGVPTTLKNCWFNSGLDGSGWAFGDGVQLIGIRHLSTLLLTQPNAWNTEAVLLPVRAYKGRPSFKASLVVDLANARHVRIDNLVPGDVLTLGPDRWKVYPWYRKNIAERNGGNQINHTGTFGWAIRYEGP